MQTKKWMNKWRNKIVISSGTFSSTATSAEDNDNNNNYNNDDDDDDDDDDDADYHYSYITPLVVSVVMHVSLGRASDISRGRGAAKFR